MFSSHNNCRHLDMRSSAPPMCEHLEYPRGPFLHFVLYLLVSKYVCRSLDLVRDLFQRTPLCKNIDAVFLVFVLIKTCNLIGWTRLSLVCLHVLGVVMLHLRQFFVILLLVYGMRKVFRLCRVSRVETCAEIMRGLHSLLGPLRRSFVFFIYSTV